MTPAIQIRTDIPAHHTRIPYFERLAADLSSDGAVGQAVSFLSSDDFAGSKVLEVARATGGIACQNAAHLEGIDPQLSALNLPFFLRDEGMDAARLDRLTGLVDEILAAKGIRLLGLMRGADQLFTHRKPGARRLDDLAGARIRVAGPGSYEAIMRALGLCPVVHLIPGMADSLRAGRLDAVFTSPGNWQATVRPLLPHGLQVPGLMMITYAVLCDADWLAGLPQPARAALWRACRQHVTLRWGDMQQDDARLLAQIEAGGGSVMTALDAAEMQQRVEPVRAAFEAACPEAFRAFGAIFG